MRRNGLPSIASAGSVLLGVFLIMGAYGHFIAVLPLMADAATVAAHLRLSAPGLILGLAGVLNITLAKSLWRGHRIGINVALGINTLALVYFVYLLWKNVPNHPIGLFAGIVSCDLVLLLGTRLGLVWPIIDNNGEND